MPSSENPKPSIPYAIAFWGNDGEAATLADADELNAFVAETGTKGDPLYIIYVDDDPTLYTIETEPRLVEVL